VETYQFGPLQVEVEYLGLMNPPWSPYAKKEHQYNLRVTDRQGNSFEGGWSRPWELSQGLSAEKAQEKTARAILLMLAYAKSEGRDWDFYGGYSGAERTWRRHLAELIQAAIKKFKDADLYKAAGIASRQNAYEGDDRGPKDWSPKGELYE